MFDKFKVGIIGYGWAAEMHAKAAKSLGIEILGVAGPNKIRRDQFASNHNISESAATFQEILEIKEIDAVIICTPNSFHFDQSMAALSLNKHVFIEKPVCTSLEDAQQLRRISLANDLQVGVGHMWRYRDEVMALRNRVLAGDFGRIVSTHGYGVHSKWGPKGWFLDKAASGGGALIDMGIHAIDTARFIIGDPLPIRVQASIGVGDFSDSPVDDNGFILVDWNNGARSLVEFGWWQPDLKGLEAETEVTGTNGIAQIWPGFRKFSADYMHCSLPMYSAQLMDFAKACNSGSGMRSSLDNGITALQIVIEAYEASRLVLPRDKSIPTWEHKWQN